MAPKDPKRELLKTVPLFAGLGGRELGRIAQLMDQVDVRAGQVLMRQGDRGSEMYVVEQGRFTVERGGQTISESGPGDVLGEIALIAEGPRTATVTAVEPSRLFVVGHREFHALMDVSPQIRSHIFDTLASRLRKLDTNAIC